MIHDRTDVFVLQSPPVPWRSILKSAPFWAILVAHMGQNYGYETLMTELPTFMKQVLHFNIKAVSTTRISLCTYITPIRTYCNILLLFYTHETRAQTQVQAGCTTVQSGFFLSFCLFFFFLSSVHSEQTGRVCTRNAFVENRNV